MSYQLIMFDLDGTISNSGPGIMESVQYALDHFDLPNQPESLLRKFVGPSLMDSFMTFYHLSKGDAEKAVALYREVYQGKGYMFHLTLYPGIADTLKALSNDPTRLPVLVTSKPYQFAGQILEKFGLASYIAFISGPEFTDPSSDKTKLINRAIEKANALVCSSEIKIKDCTSITKENALMIGDTRFDIEGAKKAGVDSVGVTYGYGSREELISSGATFLCDTAADILKFV